MLSIPQHEAEIQREFFSALLHTLRHPSSTPTFVRDLIRDIRVYYAGQDVLNLDREEIIENLVYVRKMAIRIAGSALLFGLTLLAWLIADTHDKRTGKPG